MQAAASALHVRGGEVKQGESIVVAGGWVSFGAGLGLRCELIQSVEVSPAAAANVPDQGEMATAAERAMAWYQVEVKYSPRSAPYVVFVGSERCCRMKARKLVDDLSDAERIGVTS